MYLECGSAYENDESSALKVNQFFISEPPVLSIESKTKARLMGVQINTRMETVSV